MAVSLVALVVVGGLGLFAYREWGVAQVALVAKQKALVAEQKAEKIASDAVDEFFTTVSESDLSRVPKTEGLREKKRLGAFGKLLEENTSMSMLIEFPHE